MILLSKGVLECQVEIEQALKNIVADGRVRGASTISMQAARSVYLPRSRSVVRKAAEAYYTLIMELLWDKSRILEMYLNTVDWGTGIMGAHAAAARRRVGEDVLAGVAHVAQEVPGGVLLDGHPHVAAEGVVAL